MRYALLAGDEGAIGIANGIALRSLGSLTWFNLETVKAVEIVQVVEEI